jgi:uncharacterized protein (DUF58 family)
LTAPGPTGARRLAQRGQTDYCAPRTTRLRLDGAGRVFLPLASIGLLLGWAAGGVALVFGACALAIPLVAAIWAWRNGRGLRLRVSPEPPHTVGEPFLFELELSAHGVLSGGRDLFFSLAPPEELRRASRRVPRPIGSLMHLPAGSEARVRCGHRWLRRGRHREVLLVTHSTYPFSLWRVERTYALELDALAWPRLGHVRATELLTGSQVERDPGHRRSPREQDEFHQLRPWREGMSLRRVHWKLSARRGRPILRELRGENTPPVGLGLLTDVVERRGRRGGHSFEAAVSLVATLVAHHLRQGRPVRLSILGRDLGELPELRGRGGRRQALDLLAKLEPRVIGEQQLANSIQEAREELVAGVLVAAAAGQCDERDGPATSTRLVDVDGASIDAIFQRGAEPQEVGRA